MKTAIYFVLVAFLILLGGAKSDVNSAVQPNENQLKSGPTDQTVPMYTREMYSIPLICDGVEIDRLNGMLEVFCRMHYENGKIIWMIHNFSGFLTGSTGEVFEIKGTRKIDSIEKDYTFRTNIKGDRGSHYILFGSSITTSPYTLTIDKAICPSGPNQ
jgi:hypothetical protein